MSSPTESTSTTPSSWLLPTLLGLALFGGLIFIIGFAVPYLYFDPEVMERFGGRQGWIFSHVASGIVALLVGPFVLRMGFKRSSMKLHRKVGMVYLLSIAVSAISAFYLSITTLVNWVFGFGLFGLACAWTITTGLAFIAIRKRNFDQHKEWMIRSYVVTFGFVFFRALMGVLNAIDVGTLYERLSAASWFCWAFPLVITEAFIQGKKIFR